VGIASFCKWYPPTNSSTRSRVRGRSTGISPPTAGQTHYIAPAVQDGSTRIAAGRAVALGRTKRGRGIDMEQILVRVGARRIGHHVDQSLFEVRRRTPKSVDSGAKSNHKQRLALDERRRVGIPQSQRCLGFLAELNHHDIIESSG
jgi:hypothetical protein